MKTEIVKVNFYPKSGHCYPDLVQKNDGRVKAQIRSFLLGAIYRKINHEFQEKCGSPLKSGMKVLMQVKPQFHPVRGVSLQILDIDPSFTLGEMALQKKMALAKLEKEGLLNKNKQLYFPLVPKRIAVISVVSSKGYQDFKKIIDQNAQRFPIHLELFPALLQGDEAIMSIQNQLKKIQARRAFFDLVCIIRGGGGEVGLACYDDFELAKSVANFPLPLFTGIGHAANKTVTEIVAHKSFITPTDLAFEIIQKYINQEVLLNELEENLGRSLQFQIEDQKEYLKGLTYHFPRKVQAKLFDQKEILKDLTSKLNFNAQNLFWNKKADLKDFETTLLQDSKKILSQNKEELQEFSMRNKSALVRKFTHEKSELDLAQKVVKMMHPNRILAKGFAIVHQNGEIINSSKKVSLDQSIEIQMKDGSIHAKINKHGN